METARATGARVRLTVAPSTARARPGDRVAFALTVRNSGDAPDHYRLDIVGLQRLWYNLVDTHAALAPDESRTVALIVQPMDTASFVAGRYPFRVRVTSDEAAAVQASVTVDFAVGADAASATTSGPAATSESPRRAPASRMATPVRAAKPAPAARTARPASESVATAPSPRREAPAAVPTPDAAAEPAVVSAPATMPRSAAAPELAAAPESAVVSEPDAPPASVVVSAPPTMPAPATRDALPVDAAASRRIPTWAALPVLVVLLAAAAALTLHAAGAGPFATRRPARLPRGIVKGIVARAPAIGRFVLVEGQGGQPDKLVWDTRQAGRVTLNGVPVPARGTRLLRDAVAGASYRLDAREGPRLVTAWVRRPAALPHLTATEFARLVASVPTERRQPQGQVKGIVAHRAHAAHATATAQPAATPTPFVITIGP